MFDLFPTQYQELCEKYNVSPWRTNQFIVNRYIDPETAEEFFIENHCQCDFKHSCDQCLDFETLSIYNVHAHKDCRVCDYNKKHLLVQTEYWVKFKDVLSEHDYYTFPQIDPQNNYCIMMGGEPTYSIPELELVEMTAEEFLDENNIHIEIETSCGLKSCKICRQKKAVSV